MVTTITPGKTILESSLQKPSGKMYLTGSQLNLADSVWILVELDTIPAGFTDGIEDVVNHRITPGVAGLYSVMGQVQFREVVADKKYQVAIWITGGAAEAYSIVQASIADRITANCQTILNLSATDSMELKVASIAGVNTVDLWGGIGETYFCVQRVR